MPVRACLIGTALTLFSASTLAAVEPSADPEDALRAVLSAHEQALGNHDLDALMALYAPGDETVVLGTTPPERWVGEAQIAEAYRNFFADFDAGTVNRDCPWTQVGASGDVGWVSANCDYQDALSGTPRSFSLNVTLMMERLDGTWKLRTMHFSNPTAP